jgi:hypothetical protein
MAQSCLGWRTSPIGHWKTRNITLSGHVIRIVAARGWRDIATERLRGRVVPCHDRKHIVDIATPAAG